MNYLILCAGMSNTTFKALFVPSSGDLCEFKEIHHDYRFLLDLQDLLGGDVALIELLQSGQQGGVRRHVMRLRSSYTKRSYLTLYCHQDAMEWSLDRINQVATDLRAHFTLNAGGRKPVMGNAVLIRTTISFTTDESGSVCEHEVDGFEEGDLQFIANNMQMLPTRVDD